MDSPRPEPRTVDRLAPADAGAKHQRHDAGRLLLTLSEHGCAPTKIGEYLACGPPVVTTPNVSDNGGIGRN